MWRPSWREFQTAVTLQKEKGLLIYPPTLSDTFFFHDSNSISISI
jgi:hypothetical protein